MKQDKLPSFVVIVILTTITSVVWVGFAVYRVLANKPSVDIPSEVLAPLTPTLDNTVMAKIQNRIFFEDNQIQTPAVVSPIPSLTPTPSATSSPTASSSATPTVSVSPSATPGGI